MRPARLLLLAGVMLAAAPAPVSAGGAGVGGAGAGVMFGPPFTGDRLTIVLDVPGRFDVTHFDKFGKEFAHLFGAVTCVEVRGTTAFMTGTIEGGHAPEIVGDPRGKTFPITIADHGTSDLAGVAPTVIRDTTLRASALQHGHRPRQLHRVVRTSCWTRLTREPMS